MSSLPTRAAIEKAIATYDFWFTPFELHGAISALVCVIEKKQRLLQVAKEILFSGQYVGSHTQALFAALTEAVHHGLSAQELSFDLPFVWLEDTANTQMRAEALLDWGRGFLLVTHHLEQEKGLKLDESCEDFLSDLMAMSELETQLEDDEENQQLLAVLEEHCRVGALLLFNTRCKIQL